MMSRLKQLAGAVLIDIPIYGYHLLFSLKSHGWIYVRNRRDQLVRPKQGQGVKCDWQWTSNLYLPSLFPSFGHRLFLKAFNAHPIKFKVRENPNNQQPDVSFVIGHRGLERAPLLLKTIESIAAQQGVAVQCVVVEQDVSPLIQDRLPAWVDYLFTPLQTTDLAYNRSWAFNEGVRIADADCVILHDNDLLVPTDYASETFKRYQEGYEFINLKRFIFYLNEQSTQAFLRDESDIATSSVEQIMQNAEGGGSIGASKRAFNEIGGFDERFIGWGGEDNEFWERAETGKVWPYAYLPLIHLWHGAQPTKTLENDAHQDNLYWKLTQQSPEERIKLLNERPSKVANSL